jgi:glycosyltransferase involved in cell wall biosynthesis
VSKFVFIFEGGMPVGGVETGCLRLAQGLCDAGHKAKLLIHGGPEACHPAMAHKVAGLEHEFLPAVTKLSVDQLASIYAREAPAVIFPNQAPVAYPALRAAKLSLKAALQIYGICHSDYPDRYQLAIDNQDIVSVQFGVSQLVCDTLGQRLNKPCRLIVLGLPVPAEYPSRPSRQRLEILYAGRIENFGKRCCELIPAGEALRKRGVNFRMTIVGDGPYFKWIKQDLKKVPIWRRRRYRIMGARTPEEVAEYYRAADIYLSFTRFEGNSVAVMEALAYGCVPVIPKVSGTETVIVHGQTGWLGVVDQPQTLIEACAHFYNDRSSLREISYSAWSGARRTVDVSVGVRAVLEAAGLQ